MDAILIKLIPIAYLVAAGSFFLYLFRGDTTTRLPAALLLSGFVVHSFALTTLFFQEGFAAVAVIGDALLFNSWLMVGIEPRFLRSSTQNGRAPFRRGGGALPGLSQTDNRSVSGSV